MGVVSTKLFGIRLVTQGFYSFPTWNTIDFEGNVTVANDPSNERLVITVGGSSDGVVAPTPSTAAGRDTDGSLHATSFSNTTSLGYLPAFGLLKLTGATQVAIAANRTSDMNSSAWLSYTSTTDTLLLGGPNTVPSSCSPAIVKIQAGANAITVDETNGIGFSGTTPAIVAPPLNLTPNAAPSAPGSGWTMYVDTADGRLKAINTSGQVIVLSNEIQVTSTHTLSGNNTANILTDIFQITGDVEITALYGVVSTALGANHTNSAFALYDGTNTVVIAPTGGPAASAAPVGSMILVPSGTFGTTTPTVVPSSQVHANEVVFADFLAVAKNGAPTYIQYEYSTTDAPTSGAIQFFCFYKPRSAGAIIVAV